MYGPEAKKLLEKDEDIYSWLGGVAERELSGDVLDGWENGTPRPPFQYNKYGELGKQGVDAFKYWETKLPYDKLMKLTAYEALSLNPEVKQILKLRVNAVPGKDAPAALAAPAPSSVAGPGFRAARALRARGGRTRKTKRSTKKTRRRNK